MLIKINIKYTILLNIIGELVLSFIKLPKVVIFVIFIKRIIYLLLI